MLYKIWTTNPVHLDSPHVASTATTSLYFIHYEVGSVLKMNKTKTDM